MSTAEWRTMKVADNASVARISDAVHGRYTEWACVYAERLALFPQGSHVFASDREILGYLICHPWRQGEPPQLDSLIGRLPEKADCLYLHDLALLPTARGTGAGQKAVEIVRQIAVALGLDRITLVAVNGADRFWATQGFVPLEGIAAYDAESVAMCRDIVL